MAITLTGAYGKNVAAVFDVEQRGDRRGGQGGEGAEGRTRRSEGGIQARAVRQAGSEVPLCARLDRRDEAPGRSAGSRSSEQDAARDQAAREMRSNTKLVAQLKKRAISVSAAANAVTKGVVSACA